MANPVTYWRLPAPEPYQGPEPCRACAGAKLAAGHYTFNPGGGDKVLLADVLCPGCGGCGRATHDGCDPSEHAGWDADVDEDGDQAPDCLSCRGRRWISVQAYGNDIMYELRVACSSCWARSVSCAEPLLVEVHRG